MNKCQKRHNQEDGTRTRRTRVIARKLRSKKNPFRVLQSRFAIVKNSALQWDKEKIGRIMRCCVILHNMIVENERDGYNQIDTSEFESGESSRSSQVRRRESLNVHNMLGIRTEVRNSDKHDRLKADLIENIWQMFGNVDD